MEEQEMNRSEAVQEEAKPQTSAKKQGLFHDIMDIIETMVVSVFVVLLLFTYIMRPVTVDGRSMNPTLVNQDKLVMFRLCYAPTRGDIVVVDNQEGHVLDENGRVKASGYSLHENIIKRIIAVAGQTVEVDEKAGKVYVDGVELDEPYINEPTLSNDGAFIYPITVPEGYVFVMGDNRNHSTDSRNPCVGLVAEEDVLGKAFFRYYPFSEIGFIS
ncbi:MAG: signal peptidase I [Oscillospiraceae bacterium]|nr:signal peptidase I [Oscillospiraceae bacterium]